MSSYACRPNGHKHALTKPPNLPVKMHITILPADKTRRHPLPPTQAAHLHPMLAQPLRKHRCFDRMRSKQEVKQSALYPGRVL